MTKLYETLVATSLIIQSVGTISSAIYVFLMHMSKKTLEFALLGQSATLFLSSALTCVLSVCAIVILAYRK